MFAEIQRQATRGVEMSKAQQETGGWLNMARDYRSLSAILRRIHLFIAQKNLSARESD